MSPSEPVLPHESFATFGDLLKYARRRARLTQREVAIAVGYSEAQISRLEQNLRPPDLAALTALFIPALYLEEEPEIVARLMELAAQARGENLPQNGTITFARSVRQEVVESVRTVEEGLLNNLPFQLTSFVGREGEIAELLHLLDTEGGKTRLVTLTGSGGSGKSRLALEIAKRLVESYPDGIWLIELAPISDSNLVLQTVASTLRIPESRDDMPSSAITSYLRTKHTLLIFDNCEQVVSATAQVVEEILHVCPQVQILTTSQEVLKVMGEVRYQLRSLALPDDGQLNDDLPSQPESLQLFVDRAQAVLPSFVLSDENFVAITKICRYLDGMPLAIELAAARMTTLSAPQIAARLNDSFKILGGGRATLQRHQTLQAAMDWSYNLLADPERRLLHRLSVFASGWTLEAAEAVVSDSTSVKVDQVLNLLGQLVNKSLLIVEFQAETRYRLLEVVRHFAYERLLKSGERDEIEQRHFTFYLNLVDEADIELKTANHQSWLKRLDPEKDNLRAALTRGQSARRYKDTFRFAASLFWFWQTLGYIREGRSVLENLLTASSGFSTMDHPDLTAPRAKALWAAGSLAWIQSDYATARARLEESVQLWRQFDGTNKVGLAVSLRELGIVCTYQGELDYARTVLDQSIQLMHEADEKWNLALACYNLGLVYETMNDVRTARDNFEKSLSLFRDLDEPWGLSVSLYGFGRIAGRQADYSAARFHLEESLALSRKLDDAWSVAGSLYLLGEVARLQEDDKQAIQLYSQVLILNQKVGDKAMISFTLHNIGKIAHGQGQLQRAACLFGAAKSLRDNSTNTTAWSLTNHIQCDRDIAALRAVMGEEEFDQFWSKGYVMNSDEAMEYARTLADL